jgi:hypothetical protein
MKEHPKIEFKKQFNIKEKPIDLVMAYVPLITINEAIC